MNTEELPRPPAGDDPADATGSAVDVPERDSLWASGRHRTDIAHLVMGLVFLACVGCWLLIQTDVVTGTEVRWLLPIPLVLAGAAGLVASAVVSLRRQR